MKAATSRAHRVPLGVALAVRRQIKRETGAIPVNQRGRFDPRKYALRPKAEREAAARAHTAGLDPVLAHADAAIAHAKAVAKKARVKNAPKDATPPGGPHLTPTINPPPLRPLVLARPQVRAGGEDYKQHPSRHTPAVREAYWGDHPPPAPQRK